MLDFYLCGIPKWMVDVIEDMGFVLVYLLLEKEGFV